MKPTREHMTQQEAAGRLEVSRATWYRFVQAGRAGHRSLTSGQRMRWASPFASLQLRRVILEPLPRPFLGFQEVRFGQISGNGIPKRRKVFQ
jgi:transposase